MSGCGASVDLFQPNHSNNIMGTGGVVWGCAPALCTVLSGSAFYTSQRSTIETVALAASHTVAVNNEIDFSNMDGYPRTGCWYWGSRSLDRHKMADGHRLAH
jgi:hypothetical protein